MMDEMIGGPTASSASHCAAKSGGLASAASAATAGPHWPRKSRRRASCAASRAGGGSGIHRLSWKAPLVPARTSLAQAAISSGRISSAPHEPSPPALATATVSAGAATPAIGANRMGTRRLKRAQKASVRSDQWVIAASLRAIARRVTSNSPSAPFEADEGTELVERGARRAEAVRRMRVVAVTDRDRAEQHVLGRNVQEVADRLVHARPRFLRTGVEPVAARQVHQRMDVAAQIRPLPGAELALDGDEQRDRRVEEREIALVLIEPAFRVLARNAERAVELHAVLLAPRPVRLPHGLGIDRILGIVMARVVVAADARRDPPLDFGDRRAGQRIDAPRLQVAAVL